MSRLLVFTFDGPDDAAHVREAFRDREKQGAVDLDDAVVLVKDAEGQVSQRRDRSSAVLVGAAVGAILGSLLIFMFPVISTLAGAGAGALIGRLLIDQRVEAESIADAAAALPPGSSALLVLIRAGDMAALEECLHSFRLRVFQTTLPPAQEARLRQALQ